MDLNKMKRNKCALESMTEYLQCQEEDCDEYEIRIVKDMVSSLKDSLRRDSKLRQAVSGKTE